MEQICFKVGEGTKYEINLTAIHCGDDLSVTLCGGRHHVGAVALGCGGSVNGTVPKHSATVSTLAVFDHKDDQAAYRAAKYLATELNCQVSVTAGIHIDGAKPEDIRLLLENCRGACEKLLSAVKKSRSSK